jgi:hypothetical protein
MMHETEQPTEFHTKYLPLAVFIAYCEDNHVATTRGDRGCFFTFTNPARCWELHDLYFGKEPVAVGDVRALYAVDKAIRATIRECDKSDDKIWERGQ